MEHDTYGGYALNKGLNELCDSRSASIQFLRDVLRESGDNKSCSIQDPVHVNHSELLASPKPSQESQLNEYGDVEAGPAAGAAGRSQENFVLRPLLRRSASSWPGP